MRLAGGPFLNWEGDSGPHGAISKQILKGGLLKKLAGYLAVGRDRPSGACSARSTSRQSQYAAAGWSHAVANLFAPRSSRRSQLALLCLKGPPAMTEDAVGISDLLGHLAVEFSPHGIVLPLSGPDESLERSPGLKVGGGDGFDRLAVQVAEESFQVLPGVVALLNAVEERCEGLGESGHPPERAFDLLRLNPSGTEQLLRNDWKGQTHKPPSLAYLEGLSADSEKTLREKASQ